MLAVDFAQMFVAPSLGSWGVRKIVWIVQIEKIEDL
jgi:hypothetical protein